MKTLLALFTLVLTLATGCVTAPDGSRTADVQRIARLAGVAAEIGTTTYLQKRPDARVYFEAVSNGLAALDAAQDYDPAKFAAALQALPIRELRGPEGSLYVGLAIVAWEELRAETARLDNTDWVKPVLQRVQLGFERALAATAPPEARP